MDHMKTLSLLPLALAAACTSGAASSSTNAPADVAAVDSAVRTWDAALASGDTALLRTLATPGFRMHEDDADLDLDTSVRIIGSVLGTGRMARSLDGVAIEQRGPVAWARYRAHVTWVSGRDTTEFERLESAVLERRGGRWLVAFATSMPTAPGARGGS